MDAEQQSETPPGTPSRSTRYVFGLLGFLLAVLGLACAIGQPYVEEALKPPEPPPKKLSDKLSEAGDKFVGRMVDRVRGEEPQPEEPAPPVPWGWYVSAAATSLGLAGALGGVVGWVRREDHRLSGAAMATGAAAALWVYVAAALVIALVIVVVLVVLGTIGDAIG